MARSTSNVISYYNTLPISAKVINYELANTPFSNQIFRNRKVLIQKAVRVRFSEDSWKQNPQLFCEQYYTDQYYYPVILICNGLGSIYQFTKDNLPNGIIAPERSVIGQLLSTTPLPK